MCGNHADMREKNSKVPYRTYLFRRALSPGAYGIPVSINENFKVPKSLATIPLSTY